MDNAIHKSVFEQEFTGLKSFRKFNLAGGLNNSRSGKSDQCVRFSQNKITE